MAVVQSCRSTKDPALESSTRAEIGVSWQSVSQSTARLNTNDDVPAPPGSSTLYTIAGTTCRRKPGRLTCEGAAATRDANTTNGRRRWFMSAQLLTVGRLRPGKGCQFFTI